MAGLIRKGEIKKSIPRASDHLTRSVRDSDRLDAVSAQDLTPRPQPDPGHHPSAQVYTCRMCRRVVFTENELESHETAQQGFRKRKASNTTLQKDGYVQNWALVEVVANRMKWCVSAANQARNTLKAGSECGQCE